MIVNVFDRRQSNWFIRIGRSLIVVLAATVLHGPTISAQNPGAEIMFIVPSDTPVLGGTGSEIAIFTGRVVGLIGAGSCESPAPNGYPLQHVVFVQPNRSGGGATTATVIVLSQTEPLRAGSQLEQIEPHGDCAGPDGSSYDKYTGVVVR